LVFLLRKRGNNGNSSRKVELFDAWKNWQKHYPKNRSEGMFRIRVNGKWFCRPGERWSFFHLYEVRDLLWRGVRDWLGRRKPQRDL